MKKCIIISVLIHTLILPILLYSLIDKHNINKKSFDITIETDINDYYMKKSEKKTVKKSKPKIDKSNVLSKEEINKLTESEIPSLKEAKYYADMASGNISGIKLPMPEYPSVAKKWGYTGTTEVEITIARDGKVKKVNMIKSSGYSILDRSVLYTVENKWVFPKPQNEIKLVKAFLFELE